MEQRLVAYHLARPEMRDGDLLLFRPRRRVFGRLVATAGRSNYSHAGMAAWWQRRLMCLETVQGRGGRAVLLSNLVRSHAIDVFGPDVSGHRFDRLAAVEAMIEITGRRYGWRSLGHAALVHLPLVRLFIRPGTDDAANGSLPFCSQAVARACRAGGVDPVPNLADRLTEPGDLARSRFFRYRFTLVPNTEQRQCETRRGAD